jgi:hypothetical protein
MAKLTPVSWKQLVKRLHELGFEGPLNILIMELLNLG